MISQSSAVADFSVTTFPILLSILEGLDTPVSLKVFKLLSAATLDSDADALSQLKKLTIQPSDYTDFMIDEFRLDFQAVSLLSKLPNVFGSDLKQAALDAFSSAEYQCNRVNRDFLSGNRDLQFSRCETSISFDDIKRKLNHILGKAPTLEELSQLGGWGPGASYALSREMASPEYKSEYENTITYKLLQVIQYDVYDWLPWLKGKTFELVPGNLVTTVPKNLKTDRTIAIEPGLNSFFQKGIGSQIRRRLRRFNIDLNNQGFNQAVPEVAIRDGLCTIDLAAASDSISLEFVRRVLPYEWLELIELTRSERGTFFGRKTKEKIWFEYEKVSSMGNGFTFELESALFFSVLLALGIPKELCYVYGDDLCFPADRYYDVCAALRGCGFEVNSEKSFASGLFYESCGVYTFNGAIVNPIKVKDLLNGSKDFIVLANKIRLFSSLLCNGDGCSRRLLPSWRMCLAGLPDNVRRYCRGPIGSGLTLFCNLEECNVKYSRKRGAFHTNQLVQKTVDDVGTLFNQGTDVEGTFESLMHHRLRQLSNLRECSLYDNPSVNRGNVMKTRTKGRWLMKPLFVEQWTRLGPWI